MRGRSDAVARDEPCQGGPTGRVVRVHGVPLVRGLKLRIPGADQVEGQFAVPRIQQQTAQLGRRTGEPSTAKRRDRPVRPERGEDGAVRVNTVAPRDELGEAVPVAEVRREPTRFVGVLIDDRVDVQVLERDDGHGWMVPSARGGSASPESFSNEPDLSPPRRFLAGTWHLLRMLDLRRVTMPQDGLSTFAQRRPTAHHVTFAGAWTRMCKGGMHSAATLVRMAGLPASEGRQLLERWLDNTLELTPPAPHLSLPARCRPSVGGYYANGTGASVRF